MVFFTEVMFAILLFALLISSTFGRLPGGYNQATYDSPDNVTKKKKKITSIESHSIYFYMYLIIVCRVLSSKQRSL